MILIDSDAIIAVLNNTDSNFARANRIALLIQASHSQTFIASTTAAECITSLHRQHNRPDLANIFIESLQYGISPTILTVDGKLISEAIKIYDPRRSKKHTFFDAVNIAVAQKEGIETVFSFDNFYKSFDLHLLGDSS